MPAARQITARGRVIGEERRGYREKNAGKDCADLHPDGQGRRWSERLDRSTPDEYWAHRPPSESGIGKSRRPNRSAITTHHRLQTRRRRQRLEDHQEVRRPPKQPMTAARPPPAGCSGPDRHPPGQSAGQASKQSQNMRGRPSPDHSGYYSPAMTKNWLLQQLVPVIDGRLTEAPAIWHRRRKKWALSGFTRLPGFRANANGLGRP